MDEIKFTGEEMKGRKAVINGYIYTRQRAGTEHKWSQWFCTKRVEGCSGRVHISPGETDFKLTCNHNHIPNYGEAKAKLIVSSVKRRATEEPNLAPMHVTQDALTQSDAETLAALPKEASLKRAIQRERRKHQPALPTSISDLEEVPDMYSYVNGENWVLFDNRHDENNNRVIIFGLQESIRNMVRSKLWFGDGTFQCVPKIFTQLYTLHYEINDNVLHGCFALMQNKTERSYEIMFNALRDLLPRNQQDGPERFSSDFELAATNAFSTTFPTAEQQFCYFHFSQSLWRKAQTCGIAAAYGNENELELRAQFHACLSLAFVPPEHVQAAFTDLWNVTDERLDDIFHLLEDYYIVGRRRGRGRSAPRYPIQSWNVYERTVQGIPRTNNTAEAWNRRWKVIVGKAHPNIFAMLEKMMKEVQYSATQLELVELGNPPAKKKTKYVHNDERLQRLAEKFDEIVQQDGDEDPWKNKYLKYLRSIGHSARGIFDM